MPTIRSMRFYIGLALLAAALMPLVQAAPAYAASSFTVNSSQDLPDKAPGNGICDADVYRQAGICTLRAAIMESNALADGALFHSITLPAGTYGLSRVGEDDNAFDGDLDITGNLTLNGAGAGSTIVEWSPNAVIKDRLIHILSGAQVTISDITFRNGASSDHGGGILNQGTLALTNSVVSGNKAASFGGGVASDGGSLTIVGSTISGNTGRTGGGVNNLRGSLTLNGSIVSGNTSDRGGGVGVLRSTATLSGTTISNNVAIQRSEHIGGGGIYNYHSTLLIQNSTISANYAPSANGGGIFNNQPYNTTLLNTTVSGNRTTMSGGGIYNSAENLEMSILRLYNATIANNLSDSDSDFRGSGGGLFNQPGGTVSMRNSILGGNARRWLLASADDCAGAIAEAFSSLIQTMKGCSFTGPSGRNMLNVDPKLGPLADNGGTTATHALLGGSPAIDAGTVEGCQDDQGQPLATDQRGAVRPLDGNGDLAARCDIGAYEAGLDAGGGATGQAAAPQATSKQIYLPIVAGVPPASVANNNFEAGRTDWTEYSARSAYPLISKVFPAGVAPHGGQYAVWLGGAKNETSYVQQQLTVPAGSPYLAYWHWIASSDYCGYDFGSVVVNDAAVAIYNLCADTVTGGWAKRVVNLSAYAGKSVMLRIQATTDFSRHSSLYIDDVAFQSAPGLASEQLPAVATGALDGQSAAAAEKPPVDPAVPDQPFSSPKPGFED